MDAARVMMLAASSALFDLPPDLEKLASDEEFWQRLARTPDNQLDRGQWRMLNALGVHVLPEPAAGEGESEEDDWADEDGCADEADAQGRADT